MAQPIEQSAEQVAEQPSLALVPDLPLRRQSPEAPPRVLMTDEWTGRKFWATMRYFPGWLR